MQTRKRSGNIRKTVNGESRIESQRSIILTIMIPLILTAGSPFLAAAAEEAGKASLSGTVRLKRTGKK